MSSRILLPLILAGSLLVPVLADPGNAFVYQGRVTDNGTPMNGTVSMRFSLFTQPATGTQVGATLTFPAVAVSNGLFTQQLDFGEVLDGTPLFLNVEVDGDGGANSFTTLSPRRSLSPVPYAMHAENSTTPSALDAIDGSPHESVLVKEDGEAVFGQGLMAGPSSLVQFREDKLDIAVKPSALFIGVQDTATIMLGTEIWQSFSAPLTGPIASIDILRLCEESGAVVTLHEGTGPGGTVIGTSSVRETSASLEWQTVTWTSDINLTQGEIYTVRFAGVPNQAVAFRDLDPYGSGTSNVAGRDLCFRLRMFQPGAAFDSVLQVDASSGNIGINAPPGAEALFVGGSANFDNGTLFVQDSNNRVGIGIASPAHALDVVGNARIDATTFFVDATNNRVGVGTASPARALDVVGNARISTDLVVDTSTLIVDSVNNRVGIGTLSPGTSLDVAGNARVDGTTFVVDSTNNRVGIGVAAPTQALDVAGSARIDSTTFVVDSTNNRVGIGTATPFYPLEVIGDAAIDVTTLVVDSANNRVGIGTASPTFTLDVQGNARYTGSVSMNGGASATSIVCSGDMRAAGSTLVVDDSTSRVGIGMFNPESALHVQHVASGSALDPAENVAYFENLSNTGSGDVLLLSIPLAQPGTGCNYVTFAGFNSTLGAIQGNGAGGVEFAGPGNDYAEWLPRLDVNEILEPGDVVGVFGGRITRRTEGADAIMVLSSNPIVTGNTPVLEEDDHLGNRVAFVGQASIRVRGPVKPGDYIVASGNGDGIAFAVDPALVTREQAALSIGKAWEGSREAGLKKINTIVGLAQSPAIIAALSNRIDIQQQQIELLSKRLDEVEKAQRQAQVAWR